MKTELWVDKHILNGYLRKVYVERESQRLGHGCQFHSILIINIITWHWQCILIKIAWFYGAVGGTSLPTLIINHRIKILPNAL